MTENVYYEKVVQYEPVMVFGQGENFFPSDVEQYIAKCSLHTWIGGPHHVMRVPPGELRLKDLYRWENLRHFLVYADSQFWDDPHVEAIHKLKAISGEYYDIPMEYLIRDVSDHGYPGNEEQALWKRIRNLNSVLDLAGIATRGDLPQAIFDIARTNNGDLSISPPTYYYRVFDKRKTGARYDVIQYWFFYSFNDWAFSHFGVNDHEADWESVFVYFDDINTSDVPAGMVYSAHSDKLFRPWPSVSRMGDHPVIHVAPGSHASYPPTTIPNLMLAIPKRPATALRQLFYRIIESWKDGGEIIGGGEGHPWARRHDLLSTENAPWVTKYRGRWGARYLVDMPLRPRQQAKPGGSPGGPMWNGDGTIRLKWEDPVKWARV